MIELAKSKVTLINKRDGQERYTRYSLVEVVEMIRTGKLKSGRPLKELTEYPSVCFASAIKNQDGQRWTYIYNGFVLLEINNLPELSPKVTREEVQKMIDAAVNGETIFD